MTNTAAINTLAELLDELSGLSYANRPDLNIWLDIRTLATKMCTQLNAAEAPEPTDA